jgi:hypothetical protein
MSFIEECPTLFFRSSRTQWLKSYQVLCHRCEATLALACGFQIHMEYSKYTIKRAVVDEGTATCVMSLIY